VQCAGIITFDSPSADCSLEIFDRENAINYKGLWLCTREVIKIMREQSLDCDAYPGTAIPRYRAQRGSIVSISSGMALRHQRGCPIYSASKAAVLAVSRGDGVDYAADRIRVNSVLPGLVDSPMTAADDKKRQFLEERVQTLVPWQRFGQPEEVADVCVFLAGNKASYITAAAWHVDGGRCGT
jgi:NAD(P)-dependent dehydrogenase (short-subunit alcohol dehydrogenase family)